MSGLVVAIHQPEHLPWLGFWDKALQADCLALLDTVQYRKQYVQNRNRIRTPDGWAWVTVPVKPPLMAPIHDIRIAKESPVLGHSVRLMRQHYRRAPWCERYFPAIAACFRAAPDRLVDLNVPLIRYLAEALGIQTRIIVASELNLPPARGATEVNVSICRHLGAGTYLSGISGRDYLDVDAFQREGIAVRFQEFHHPIYRQCYEPFVPALSCVDLLFNYGPQAADILRGETTPRLQELFR